MGWGGSSTKPSRASPISPVSRTGRYEIYTKRRDYARTALKDLITNIPNGDAQLRKLFDGKKVFDYPKSVELLETLLGAVPDRDALVLDFFSGSATTAHAVMSLRA